MIEINHQAKISVTRNSRWGWLCKIGGVSALIVGTLLLFGMINLVVSVLLPRTTNGWLSQFEDNWLVKIFILHAEISNIYADLHGVNLLDIITLLLVSVICFSISTIFIKAKKVWSLLACALSVIAIVLFLATQITGRSTVMLAVLIISFVILKEKTFSNLTAYTGVLASVFLFVGDLTVGVHSNIITAVFGIGYVLLITWFFLIAQSLLRIGYVSSKKYHPTESLMESEDSTR
jgi:hypothetical protein